MSVGIEFSVESCLIVRSHSEQACRAAIARHASLSLEAQFALARAAVEAARLRFGWQRADPMDRMIGHYTRWPALPGPSRC